MSDPDDRSYIKEISMAGEWQPVTYGDFLIRAWQKNPEIVKNTPFDGMNLPEMDNNRHLCYYVIYHLKPGEEGNAENWTLLNQNVLDEFYYDTGWISQDTGYYRYAVIARYSYNESEPVLSNVIRNGINVSINISTDCSASPKGAHVLLKNDDNNPAHVYEAFTPENGVVVFGDVAPGDYSFSTELAYFSPYYLGNINIVTDTSLSLIIHSACLPPIIIRDPSNPGTFRFFFTGDAVTIYSEDFEAGLIPPRLDAGIHR